jgi:FMN phosphatase YigB (HAD superfamily)
MYLRAIKELDLDPRRSLFVGDRFRDLSPGLELGGWAVLVPSVESAPEDVRRAESEARVAATLSDAVAEWMAASDVG